MKTIHTCLWFDKQAEEAAKFYTDIFPDSRILSVSHYGEGMPLPAGTAMVVKFELGGRSFMALNGGPVFKLSEAVSIVVPCESQAELDGFWDSLLDGGEPAQCGWLKDRFGLSWQLVPTALEELMSRGTAEQSARMMGALLQMVKLDIAALEAAFNG